MTLDDLGQQLLRLMAEAYLLVDLEEIEVSSLCCSMVSRITERSLRISPESIS